MTTTTTTAPTAPPSTIGTEFATAGGQIAALVRSGVRTALRPRQWGWRTALVVMWVVGIAGDAYTTLSMMATGLFEEANGAAAAGMAVLGPVGYTILASLVCAAMGVTSLGRPVDRYDRLLTFLLLAVGAGKVYIAVSNLLLWVSI